MSTPLRRSARRVALDGKQQSNTASKQQQRPPSKQKQVRKEAKARQSPETKQKSGGSALIKSVAEMKDWWWVADDGLVSPKDLKPLSAAKRQQVLVKGKNLLVFVHRTPNYD